MGRPLHTTSLSRQALPPALSLLNFFDLDRQRVTELLVSLGFPQFTSSQLWEAIYGHGDELGAITSLSRDKRAQLAREFRFDLPTIEHESVSSDGTYKWLMGLPPSTTSGSTRVETVFIPNGDRGTLCISSQAGCSLACKFCRTGTQQLDRNLSAADIAGQVLVARRRLAHIAQSAAISAAPQHHRIDNVVLMGQGEPGYNPTKVLTALRILTAGHLPRSQLNTLPALSKIATQQASLPPHRITISTAGVAPFITRLGREPAPYRLAISLHAASDELRTAIMPINATYPLKAVMSACKEYISDRIAWRCDDGRSVGQNMPLSSMRTWLQTNGEMHNGPGRIRVSFEYVLLHGVNDSPQHARELAKLLDNHLPSEATHVNLLHFNPWPGAPYNAAPLDAAFEFQKTLQMAGLHSTMRKSRGSDVLGACGQLKSATAVKLKLNRQISGEVRQTAGEI
jgi:23S rRNA (adenine2503-C2)-methyltransferase